MMMRTAMLLPILAALSLVTTGVTDSIAANISPKYGLSIWVHQECLTKHEQDNIGCNPEEIEIMLFRKNRDVCGIVYVRTVFKDSENRIAGHIKNNVLNIAYTNSWTDQSKRGHANITFKNNKLHWKTLSTPPDFAYDPPDTAYYLIETNPELYVPDELVSCASSKEQALRFLNEK